MPHDNVYMNGTFIEPNERFLKVDAEPVHTIERDRYFLGSVRCKKSSNVD